MSNLVDTLLASLPAEIDAVSTFIALLEQEAALLTNSTALDDLPALTEAKQTAAHALQVLVEARVRQLHLPAGADPRARMDELAEQNDALKHAWHTLVNLGHQAHTLNTRNAALIDVHLRHTQQSLHALRTSAGMTEVYTARGKTRRVHRSTAIAAG